MKFSKTTLSVFFSLIAIIAVFVCVKAVQADTSSNMSGYAWSSNIGWIKLNDCDDPTNSGSCGSASYGVNVLPGGAGTLSGYAWSSNIGWVTFNASGCPVSGCTSGAHADWSHPNGDGSVNIRGWARACSVYASGCSGALKDDSYLGSWDGYIALDSASAGGSGGTWGLAINPDNSISGYAWGSQVIGWIKSISAKLSLTGSVTLTANPTVIQQGGSSTLTATARNIDNADSCSIDNAAPRLTMTQGANGWTGSVVVSPGATTTYTVTCVKSEQSFSGTATVTVTFFTPPTNPNQPGGPGGPGGTGGGYCALTNPQFAWDSDATSCSITEQGGGSISGLAGSSKAAGGTLGNDGLYYYTAHLPIQGSSAVYTLQCTGGSQAVNLQTTVESCQKDFALVPTPSSADLVASADGKTFTATFTVSIVPQYGFTDNVTLSVDSSPSGMPKHTYSFSPTTLSSTGGAYGTSTFTVTVNAVDLKSSGTYPIVIKGVSDGGITRKANITLNSLEKTKPVFNEF